MNQKKNKGEQFLPPQRRGGKSYQQYLDTLKRCKDGQVVTVQMIEGGIVCMDYRLFHSFGCTLSESQVRQALARAYCHRDNQHKMTDPALMDAMTKEIITAMRGRNVPPVPDEPPNVSGVALVYDERQEA